MRQSTLVLFVLSFVAAIGSDASAFGHGLRRNRCRTAEPVCLVAEYSLYVCVNGQWAWKATSTHYDFIKAYADQIGCGTTKVCQVRTVYKSMARTSEPSSEPASWKLYICDPDNNWNNWGSVEQTDEGYEFLVKSARAMRCRECTTQNDKAPAAQSVTPTSALPRPCGYKIVKDTDPQPTSGVDKCCAEQDPPTR